MSDDLAQLCERHRLFALQQPVDVWKLRKAAQQPRVLAPYSFLYRGRYCVSITYESYQKPPRWHAQVTILEEIGELQFGAAQQALLAFQSWSKQDIDEATDILGECLAPEMVNSMQGRNCHAGLWSMHLLLDDAREEQRGELKGPGIIIPGH